MQTIVTDTEAHTSTTRKEKMGLRRTRIRIDFDNTSQVLEIPKEQKSDYCKASLKAPNQNVRPFHLIQKTRLEVRQERLRRQIVLGSVGVGGRRGDRLPFRRCRVRRSQGHGSCQTAKRVGKFPPSWEKHPRRTGATTNPTEDERDTTKYGIEKKRTLSSKEPMTESKTTGS